EAGGLGTCSPLRAIEAELVDDQKREAGVEAHAVMDGLVGQSGGEVFEQLAAGDVTDALFEQARGQSNALDEPALSQSRLPDKDDILLAADEVALGQGLDLEARDGRIEVPIEGVQRQRFPEVGVLDETFDAALAAQAGLVGQQPMEEL